MIISLFLFDFIYCCYSNFNDLLTFFFESAVCMSLILRPVATKENVPTHVLYHERTFLCITLAVSVRLEVL